MKGFVLGGIILSLALPVAAAQEEAWVKTVRERHGNEPPTTRADWVQIATDEGKTVFYIDRASIRRQGQYITAWEKQDHRADRTLKTRESKLLYLYDCRKRAAALREAHNYMPDGSHEGWILTDEALDWRPMRPGTVGPPLLDYVCAQQPQ